MKLITITPRPTEKAYRLATTQNTYVFNVPLDVNKNEIALAIEKEFEGVKVASVSTAVQNGKSVRFNRGKRRYPGTTTRSNTKKAYVVLSEGSIQMFDSEDSKKEKS